MNKLDGAPPARPWRRRLSAVSAAVAAGLVALAATSTAAAATTGEPAGAMTAVSAAPAGFAPSSTSWTGPGTGWALGFASCPAGACPALLRTTDGARSWQPHTPPRVSSTPDRTRIRFADDLNGWATDGDVLWSTHDGAGKWGRVRLPGAYHDVAIQKLAATDRYVYAIVSHGSANDTVTELYSSPIGADRWQQVPGVSVPGAGGWDIATNGSAAYVSLGVVHVVVRQWSTVDGAAWTEGRPVCSVDSAVRLSSTRPDDVQGMCSSDPFRGYMLKLLVDSAAGGSPVVLGQAPSQGITTGFSTTPGGTAVVAGVGAGASWLHASFDDGATWETPLLIPDIQLPMLDVAFQDDAHGVVVYGGADWQAAVLYRTTDGGHTWSPVTF
jgi:photosystem II stability/assembly factor-like uncharacterized protein